MYDDANRVALGIMYIHVSQSRSPSNAGDTWQCLEEEYDSTGRHSNQGDEPADDVLDPGNISDGSVGQIAVRPCSCGPGDPGRRGGGPRTRRRRPGRGGTAELGIDRAVSSVDVKVVDLELQIRNAIAMSVPVTRRDVRGVSGATYVGFVVNGRVEDVGGW